jgi:D-glycero-D-manno-heptose 1,7-bisphosphate phosphatase
LFPLLASSSPVVILDRDGTIIVDKNYLSDPHEVEFLPSAVAGLQRLTALGLRLILVTNQSGVGRGFFTMREVNSVNERMLDLLRAHGVEFVGVFVCPHAPNACCDCRKPKTGLVTLAGRELNLDLRKPFVIGDKPCDVRLGHNLGGTTFMVGASKSGGASSDPQDVPHFFVLDLLEAAQSIERQLKASRVNPAISCG